MCKAVWLLLAILAATFSEAAGAASPNPTSAGSVHSPPSGAVAAQPPSPSSGELQQLVNTLQSDQQRAKLIAQLQTLIAAQHHAEPAKSEGVALLGRLSTQIDAFTGEILAGVAMVVDAPRLIRWAREQMHNPTDRERWASAAQAFVIVFGGAAAAEAALRWVIARTRPKFPVRRRDTRAIKALFALLAFILDLAPILVFAAIVYGAVAMALDLWTPTGITMSVLAVATIEARLILVCRTRRSDPAR